MKPEIEQRLKEIDREIVRVAIIDAPGTIMVGLGLYAIFGAKGDAFLPILNNQTIVTAMLAVGAAIMLWGGFKTISLTRERARLQKERDQLGSLSQQQSVEDRY